MRKALQLLSVLSVALVLLAPISKAQHGLGGITGVALDSEGQPAVGTQVEALPVKMGEIVPVYRSTSGEDGRFSIGNIPPGDYYVAIWDETRGVPNGESLIFRKSGSNLPRVTVIHGKTVDLGRYTLAKPFAALELTVIDKKSRVSVPIARCTIRRRADPRIFLSTDSLQSSFRFLLPPEPISIEITSLGYKTYRYSNPETGSLFLPMNVETKLTVALERAGNGIAKPDH